MIEEIDEETKAKRRAEQIEYRNKKRFSNMFMFFATIFEIVETFALIVVSFFIFAFILFKVFHAEGEIAHVIFEIATVAFFIGGLIFGFIIYKKIIQWVIKKYNLEDKLLDDVKIHYIKQTKEEMEEELKS